MKRILEDISVYIIMVFHPRVLVRITREYLRATEALSGMNEDVKEKSLAILYAAEAELKKIGFDL